MLPFSGGAAENIPIEPEDLKAALEKDVNKEIKVVTLTHSETSTGAKNDIKTLCKIISDHGAISVVDGVTSVGCMDVKMDGVIGGQFLSRIVEM